LEKGSDIYFFATDLKPNPTFDMACFPSVRKKVTMEAFEALEIIDA